MNWKRATILTAVLLSAVLPSTAATLAGSVRTAGGTSVQARISVLRMSGALILESHDTGEDGSFSIEVSSSGLIAVAASLAGYASEEVSLTGGIPSGSLTFTLQPLREVRGTVRDSRGRAVPVSAVTVRRTGGARHIHLDHFREAVTDSDGRFTVRVPGGSIQSALDMVVDGWVPQSLAVRGGGSVGSTGVGEGSSLDVLISLELQGASVSGTVRSPDSSLLPGIRVLAGVRVRHAQTNEATVQGGITGPGTTETIRPYGRTYRTSTTTDSQGRYSFAGLPPGNLGVVAIRRGTTASPQRFQAGEGDSFTANFVLPE